MPIFLYPIGAFVVRSVTKSAIAEAIESGIAQATGEAVARIISTMIANSFVVFMNILFIVGGVYFFGGDDTSILIITTIYASSVMYGLYSFVVNAPTMFKIIFYYKFNVVGYVEDQIHEEVYRRARKEIDGLGFFSGIANSLFGKNALEIANDVTSSAIRKVIERIGIAAVSFVVAFMAYVFVFRFYVAPVLMEDATDLTMIQAFLWPFAYSVDYFLGMNLLDLVQRIYF